MTLLDEYQALPGEPIHQDFNRLRVLRRDAVIRLLARVLRAHLDPNIAGHCGDEGCDICDAQAELRALLTAVERDFPENSNG
jgi:hypothetical protein